jgi:hypothetical protein
MKQIILSKQKSWAAVGLVEVLIVLALVATTMVAATQVTVQALIKIKEDEINDYVNGLMVRTLEAAKSPQTLTINNQLTGLDDFEGSYTLQVTDDGNPPAFTQEAIELTPIPEGGCSISSPYSVTIPNLGNFTPPPVCLQAIVAELEGIDVSSIFQITVRAVYNLSSGPVEREVVGYRRADPTSIEP